MSSAINVTTTTTITNTSDIDMTYYMGPVRDPLTTVIPMTIVYLTILFTGVIGNLCTCTVIARNKYMHTATNYYLFSLAVSDLLLLILGLPQELYLLWQKYPYVFGESFCILRGLTSEISTNASILTITAFTVERYVAICHPLKAHTMSQLPRAIKTILLIWAFSAICAIPVAYQFGIIYNETQNGIQLEESAQCAIERMIYPYVFEIATLVLFVIPISVISVLYVLIGVQLRRSSHQVRSGSKELSSPDTNLAFDYQNRHNSTSSAQQRQNASRRSVVKMLVAVVISFFFCYSPFHAQRVLATILVRNSMLTPVIMNAYTILTHISGVTYYLSSTINPILYQVMSRKFRIAFRDTFGRWFPCVRQEDIPEMNYSAIITATPNCSKLYYRSGPSYKNGNARKASHTNHASFYDSPSTSLRNNKNNFRNNSHNSVSNANKYF